MLSFMPGLSQVDPDVLKAGAQPMMNYRSAQFADLFHECIDGLRYVFQTNHDVAILTASGSAAMEASVVNFLKPNDQVLIINSGSFAQRWQAIAKIYSISCDEFVVPIGEPLDLDALNIVLKKKAYRAVMLVAHESSVGTLFDVKSIGRIVKANVPLFMVNAISTICADPFFMDDWQVDVAILSSHKALALPPGLAFLSFNKEFCELQNQTASFYLNLNYYLDFQKLGQTPFVAPVNLFLMLQERLKAIKTIGIEGEIEKHALRANYFRQALSQLSFERFSLLSSNTLTAVSCPPSINAKSLVGELAANAIYVGGSAPAIADKVFRVSHTGFQKKEAVNRLLAYLSSLPG